MTKPLEQVQAAEVAGLTAQGLQKIQKTQSDAPQRTAEGGYPCLEFGEWLRRRIASQYGVADDGRSYDYDAERARLTKAQADKTELEAAELAGEIVRVEQVIATWSKLAGAMRARLLAMPSKIAPVVRVTETDEEASATIEREVLEALEELSSDGLPESARARRARAARDSEAATETDGEPVGGSVPSTERRKRGRAGPVAH